MLRVGDHHPAADDPRPGPGEGGGRARELLADLGLAARAVANAPRVLPADEPTGNLDPKTADHVFGTLTELVKARRVAALVATHNLELAGRMDRRVTLREGAGGGDGVGRGGVAL